MTWTMLLGCLGFAHFFVVEVQPWLQFPERDAPPLAAFLLRVTAGRSPDWSARPWSCMHCLSFWSVLILGLLRLDPNAVFWAFAAWLASHLVRAVLDYFETMARL